MTKRKRKYFAIIQEFKPGSDDHDYNTMLKMARQLSKSMKIKLTDPFDVDHFIDYSEKAINFVISMVSKLDIKNDPSARAYLTHLKSKRAGWISGKDQMIKDFGAKGIPGRDLIIEIAKTDPNASRIANSSLVKTMGDFIVAQICLEP